MFASATALALSPEPLLAVWAPLALVALWGIVHHADLRPLASYWTDRL
jgi:hypothetical protein